MMAIHRFHHFDTEIGLLPLFKSPRCSSVARPATKTQNQYPKGMKTRCSILAASALVAANMCEGSVVYTTTGQTINQNFDGLGTIGASWADDTTLSGWYARTDATASISAYGANTGSTTTAGLYSFGVAGVNAVTDRALGYIPSNAFTGPSGTGQGYLGFRINNGTGLDLTQFTISYTGEQWRRENTSVNTLTVQYKFGATAVNDATGWTTISGLQFSSPQVGTAGAIDGNNSANRTVFSGTGVNDTWLNGQDLWIRWVDLNEAGNDQGLAIDDFTLTAVPEPTNIALGIFGIGLIAFSGTRALKKKLKVAGPLTTDN